MIITRRQVIATGLLATTATGAFAQGHGQRLCVFGIGGTLNALGAGDPAKAPKVPPAVLAFSLRDRKIVRGNDPIPGGGNGSPWPAFGVAFHQATKMAVMFVQCAGGDYQTAKFGRGRGHWDGGGALVSLMFLALDDALKVAKQAGYDARLSGILWCQGETDGNGLGTAELTPDEYKTAFRKMVERFRVYYSPTLPFYVFRTGSGPAAATERGYALVRAAQEEFARTLPNVIIASRLAVQFAERGQLVANAFFNQDANNDLGRDGALNVAASKLWNVW